MLNKLVCLILIGVWSSYGVTSWSDTVAARKLFKSDTGNIRTRDLQVKRNLTIDSVKGSVVVTNSSGKVIRVPDGSNNQVLQTDGAGHYSFGSKIGVDSGTIQSINGSSEASQTITGQSPWLSVTESGTGNAVHTIETQSGYIIPTGSGNKVDSATKSNTSDTVKHQRLSIVSQGSGITVTRSNDTFAVSLYSPPVIASLTNNQATHYAGQTVTGLTASWTLSGAAITSQTITDAGSLSVGDRTHVFSGLTLTSDKYYTLSVTDGVTPTSATTWVYFYIQKYMDTCSGAEPSEAQIRARASSWTYQNAAYRTLASTAITGGGKYIYYAFPASWGSIYFLDGAIPITWNLTTVSITNSYGDTRNYSVYTSPNPIVGTIHLTAIGN
jgi:hypothetical protein